MPRIISKLDATEFRRKMGRITARAHGRQVKVILEELAPVAAEIEREWPRDTNRSIRGWLEAFNDVGLGPFALPDIQASTSPLAAKLRETLHDNAEFYAAEAKRWEERADHVEEQIASAVAAGTYRRRRGRPRKGPIAQRRIAQRYRRLATRAAEELAKLTDTAIVLAGRSTKSRFALGRLATVRAKVYGGRGSVSRGAGTVVTIHNREPHASIVEWKHKVVARALRRLRGGASLGLFSRYAREFRKDAA